MKSHLSVFALSAILIASVGMTPVFGQILDPIVVSTDKESYSEGEKILVTGEVKDLYGIPVTIQIISPNGNRVGVQQIDVGDDKKFSHEFTAGGTIKWEGSYTIMVQYGENRKATTTFEFGGSTITPSEPPVDEETSIVTDTTVLVEGASDLIEYTITGGKILGISPDVNAKSLIISIEAIEDGSMTLTIPRSVLEAMIDGVDTDFFVTVDFEEKEFEETVTETHRTLTIEFPAGAEEIEIIGTYVIPEFGTIAAMILAVAIISIIAVSAKSRLSIVPRY